jgi:hypothetical protein
MVRHYAEDGAMSRVLPAVLFLAVSIIPVAAARAAPPVQDPDWPCEQRLVPTLTAATYWNGLPARTDHEAELKVAAIVSAVAPRDIPMDIGVTKLDSFADSLAPSDRQQLLPQVFASLVDEINRQRREVIDRIKGLARRQRGMGDQVAKLDAEIGAIPADATGEEATRRDALQQEHDLLVRAFDETQRTLRYACNVPVDLDKRLGLYARALQAKLGS